MNKLREPIVESLVEHVIDHKELNELADRVARQFSGTEDIDMGTIEETHQYGLYWASYAEEQARIVGMVQQKLFAYQK